MKCERVEELLIDYLAGEIEPAENRLVQNHLQSCHGCSAKFSEFKEIRSAFRSEILPEPSAKVLESLTIKAKQDLRNEKVSFWKKWFYSPVLIPTLTTAIALMVWINYKDSNQPPFDDTPEYYSREVMAEKIPSGKFANKDIAAEGAGRIQAKKDSSGAKQNEITATNRAASELRRDAAAHITTSINGLPQSQISKDDDGYYKEIENMANSTAPARQSDLPEAERSFKDENYEASKPKPASPLQAREESLDDLKNTQSTKGKSQVAADDETDIQKLEQMKPDTGAKDGNRDADGFRFSLGSSKVMAKKIPQDSYGQEKAPTDMEEVRVDNKEQGDIAGLDYATEAKISEQVRSTEKTEEIDRKKLEDSRFREVDSPKELTDKNTLRQLNVALSQQKAGDCESAIITNENNLKNIPAAPDEVKEQTYLSLAQCYEQQNMYVKAIENYNYLQQVAPTQKVFATEKIQMLNFKVQNMNVPATLSEPSTTSETGVEVTK